MNAKKFSDVMSELDSKYVGEALSYNKKTKEVRHVRRFSIVSAAAVFALLLLGCAAVTAGVFGTQLIDIFTSRGEPGSEYKESGYDLEVAMEKIPAVDLRGEISETGEIIRKQFEEYEPYQSWFPGEWQNAFASRDEACEYIGLDSMKRISWEPEEQATTLHVFGNERGEILSVNLETSYTVDKMNVQFFSQIYTEHYEEEITFGTRIGEDVEFDESFYTTKNNHKCHIIESSAMESGYMGVDAYIADKNVLYSLYVAYKASDHAQAMEIVHQWADLF